MADDKTINGSAVGPTPLGALAQSGQPTKGKTPIGVQLGHTGLKEYSGYLSEEFLTQLRGREAAKIYTEMGANDGIIAAMLYACGMLIRAADWRVEPIDDSDAADEAKKFVEECMEDMEHSWGEFIEEVTSFLQYGFAPFEIVYKVRKGESDDKTTNSKFSDSRVGIRKLALRSQDTLERWLFDDQTDELLGMVQVTDKGQIAFIPQDRLLNFRTVSRKDNPEGVSVLRSSYVSYIRKKAIEDAEGRAALRAAGLVLMRLPGHIMSADADEEERTTYNAYKTLATKIARDQQGAIVLPSNKDESGNFAYDLTFVVADGRRATDFSSIIDRHNKQMTTSILADFLFLGQASVGSFALSSDKTALFSTALGAYLKGIESVLNRQFLPRLWKMNNMDPELMPKIVAGDVETPNLTEMAQYVAALAGAGMPMFPDEDLEQQLRSIANLPERSQEALKAQQEEKNREFTMQGRNPDGTMIEQDFGNNEEEGPDFESPEEDQGESDEESYDVESGLGEVSGQLDESHSELLDEMSSLSSQVDELSSKMDDILAALSEKKKKAKEQE